MAQCLNRPPRAKTLTLRWNNSWIPLLQNPKHSSLRKTMSKALIEIIIRRLSLISKLIRMVEVPLLWAVHNMVLKNSKKEQSKMGIKKRSFTKDPHRWHLQEALELCSLTHSLRDRVTLSNNLHKISISAGILKFHNLVIRDSRLLITPLTIIVQLNLMKIL